MDLSAFKMMLESQERSFKLSLDTVVKEMHNQISKLENKISELTTSLEFTQREVDELKSKVKDQDKDRKDDKNKIENLNKQVESSNQKVKELEHKVVYQEDYSRRKNLRISGLEEHGNETWEQTSAAVASLLETKLQLPGVVLERAHRIGVRRDSKPRIIVARFTRYSDRDATIRRGKYLKGTNIFLNEDLSATSQAIKNAQMPLLKQARAEGKIAFFRHTKLIIREKTNKDDTGRGQQATVVTGAVSGGVPQGAACVGVPDGAGDEGAFGGAVGGDVPHGAVGGGMPDGAVGGPEFVAGSDDTTSGVVNVEVAGVWTGKDNRRSSISSSQPGGSRRPSASPVAPPPRRAEGKRDLRSSKRK